MKLKIKQGTTNKIGRIFVADSSQSDGSGLTGLLHSTTGLSWYWIAEGDASTTSVPIVTATVGTYTSGGFIEVDATNMPGVYEIGIPDAAIDATSNGSVIMYLHGATNMAPVRIEIELDAIDYRTSLADQIDARIEYYHLHQLLAAPFDVTIHGDAGSLWRQLLEDDGGVSRLTSNALEQGVAGGLDAAGVRAAVGLTSANLGTLITSVVSRFGSITDAGGNTLSDWLIAALRKDAPAVAAIGGTYDPAADSQEAIAENLPPAPPSGNNAITVRILNDRVPSSNVGFASVRFVRDGHYDHEWTTNAAGAIDDLRLSDGLYNVYIHASNHSPRIVSLEVNGDTVAPDWVLQYQGAQTDPPAGKGWAKIQLLDEHGEPEEGKPFTVTLVSGPGTAGLGLDTKPRTVVSDVDGWCMWLCLHGADYTGYRGSPSPTTPVSGFVLRSATGAKKWTMPAVAFYNIPETLGQDSE